MSGFTDPPAREQLLNAIEADAKGLEGEAESQWLEFKIEPHLKPNRQTEDKHRFELAKDVTAMANAGGGVIVYGVDEVKDPAHPTRKIGALSPIADGIVDPDQVLEALRQWVFPASRLRVRLRERKVNGRSLWVLDIDEHPREELPFLVVREWPPGKDDKRPTRGHFTMYRRQGTSNVHVSPEEVYQWLYVGYQAGGGGGTSGSAPPAAVGPVTGTGAGTLPGLQVSGVGTVTPTSADTALREELDALELRDAQAYYYIQLIPEGSGRLERFFGRDPDELEQKIGGFTTVRRRAGFSPFSAYASTVRTTGNTLRLGVPGRSGVSVQPSALTTFVCCQDTLLWASDKHAPEGSAIINPVALPEFTIEASRFFLAEVLDRWPNPAAAYFWRIGLHGLGEPIEVHLPRGALGDSPLRLFWDSHHKPNTAEDFDSDFVRATDKEPTALAFAILSEVFHRFGYSDSDIPYRAESGDRLNLDALRAL